MKIQKDLQENTCVCVCEYNEKYFFVLLQIILNACNLRLSYSQKAHTQAQQQYIWQHKRSLSITMMTQHKELYVSFILQKK